jgi:hypothetical protein
MLLRLWGKYLHLMRALGPIAPNVFHSMTQLLDFYALVVHEFFTQNLVRRDAAIISQSVLNICGATAGISVPGDQSRPCQTPAANGRRSDPKEQPSVSNSAATAKQRQQPITGLQVRSITFPVACC